MCAGGATGAVDGIGGVVARRASGAVAVVLDVTGASGAVTAIGPSLRKAAILYVTF